MSTTSWELFQREGVRKIFAEKKLIIDIGGDLGIDPARCNRVKGANQWVASLLHQVDYKVLDKVPDYHPDIVGDIQALPLADNSVDAFICTSILQSVENPKRAVEEMYRALKPGGYCLISTHFLFYYLPVEGYYKDFWRMTEDGVRYITSQFSSVEICPVRGPIGTLFNLVPGFAKKHVKFFEWLDSRLKPNSKQVSGHYVFCIK